MNILEEKDSLIVIQRTKVAQIKPMLWSEFEDILIAIEAKFSIPNKSQFEGYLIATIGCIYIFEKKRFSDPVFIQKFTVLECNQMNIHENEYLEFEFDSNIITVYTTYTKQISKILARYEERMFWDLPFLQYMTFNPPVDLEGYRIKKRQEHALRNRCLLMAHFYNYYQPDTSVFEYIDKYDSKPQNTIVLAGHFQPGVFAMAIGHAIAWDTSILNISIQGLRKEFVGRTLSALIENSVSNDKIILSFYTTPNAPEFQFKHIHNMKIRKFWFSNCSGGFMKEFFMETVKGLPEPLEEISIARSKFTNSDFADLTSSLCFNNSVRKIQKLRFSTIRMVDHSFPFDDVTKLMRNMQQLQQLNISDIEFEASQLFKAICQAETNVKMIRIEYATFNKPIDTKRVKLPPKLVLLNISQCSFPRSVPLASLLTFLTKTKAVNPFIFIAHSLTLGKDAYKAFSHINFSQCQPNILEFDWSDNLITKTMAKGMYEFLMTQTRLQLMSFLSIKLQNTQEFWEYLTKIVMINKILGLEVTGQFPGSIFVKFIENLKPATFLQRLHIRCTSTHDNGLRALSETVKNLRNLQEIMADVFKPESVDIFLEFWNTILNHPSIRAVEPPNYDSNFLMKTKQESASQVRKILSLTKKIGKPNTIQQRAQMYADQLEKSEDFTTTMSSVFSTRYEGKYVSDSDDDDDNDELFATKGV